MRDESFCPGALSTEGSSFTPGLPLGMESDAVPRAGVILPLTSHLPAAPCPLLRARAVFRGLCSPLCLCFAVIRAKAVSEKEVDSGNDIYGNPIKRIQYEIKQIKVMATVPALLHWAELWELWEQGRGPGGAGPPSHCTTGSLGLGPATSEADS